VGQPLEAAEETAARGVGLNVLTSTSATGGCCNFNVLISTCATVLRLDKGGRCILMCSPARVRISVESSIAVALGQHPLKLGSREMSPNILRPGSDRVASGVVWPPGTPFERWQRGTFSYL